MGGALRTIRYKHLRKRQQPGEYDADREQTNRKMRSPDTYRTSLARGTSWRMQRPQSTQRRRPRWFASFVSRECVSAEAYRRRGNRLRRHHADRSRKIRWKYSENCKEVLLAATCAESAIFERVERASKPFLNERQGQRGEMQTQNARIEQVKPRGDRRCQENSGPMN